MATELFSPILQKFIDRSPVTVMAHGLLENLLNAEKLDMWFEANSGTQYTRELLFSSIVAIMLDVVCQIRTSVHAAYRKADHLSVSLASLYNKLNGLETTTSAALARRIIKLNQKTRNGDDEIRLLTNFAKEVANAETIATCYQKRWGIETAFQRLEAHFHSEINSLGYPKAALFGFCLALVAFNLYAVIMAALRAANPEVNIKDEVSEYYIAQDIAAVYDGMVIAVDYEDWELFRKINRAQMAILLIYLAKQVDLKKFRKSKRGVKKPKPEIKWDKNNPHVSTFKLLLNPG